MSVNRLHGNFKGLLAVAAVLGLLLLILSALGLIGGEPGTAWNLRNMIGS